MQLLCFAGRGLEPAACRGIIAAADYLKCDKYTTTTLHYSDLYISWALVIKVRSKDISATHYTTLDNNRFTSTMTMIYMPDHRNLLKKVTAKSEGSFSYT